MTERVNLGSSFGVDGEGQREAPGWALRWLSLSPWSWPPWHSRCQGCGERGASGRDLCPACDAALPRIRVACVTCGLPLSMTSTRVTEGSVNLGEVRCEACQRCPPPFTRVVTPFVYAPPLDRWLPRFKFHNDVAIGHLLSQLMLPSFSAAPRPDVIIPVPLHFSRLRTRGYNQALELARPIARALHIPLDTSLLVRTRATSAQSSLHAHERRRNLRGAFGLATSAINRPAPVHVTILDDVMTTGATLADAARPLLNAGVTRVDAWVCARAH